MKGECNMLLRPVDASGDILPVSSSSDLLSGPEAVARLAAYKLSLLKVTGGNTLKTGSS